MPSSPSTPPPPCPSPTPPPCENASPSKLCKQACTKRSDKFYPAQTLHLQQKYIYTEQIRLRKGYISRNLFRPSSNVFFLLSIVWLLCCRSSSLLTNQLSQMGLKSWQHSANYGQSCQLDNFVNFVNSDRQSPISFINFVQLCQLRTHCYNWKSSASVPETCLSSEAELVGSDQGRSILISTICANFLTIQKYLPPDQEADFCGQLYRWSQHQTREM